MRKRAPIVASVATLIATVFFLAMVADARKSGTNPGYTGAPAVSGNDCTNCHDGTANSGPGSVTITSQSVYVPGSVIPVTVSLSNTQNPLVNGFQAAAYNGTTLMTGWTAPLGNTSVSGDHVNQTTAGSAATSWTFYFQTPASPTTFTVYTAGLDADGQGGTSNDHTYTTSRQLTAGTVNLSMMALPQIGTTLPLALSSPGDGLKPYSLGASFGNSGITRGQRTIPLSDDGLLNLTSGMKLTQTFQNYVGFLDAQGNATANFAIPNSPLLVGVTFYHAFIVIDPGQPYTIGTISNGLAVQMF